MTRRDSGSVWTMWLREVTEVLSKPFVAITLFVLGVVFLICASKQLKIIVEFLEHAGINLREDNFISNFLAVAVFLLVWVDIILLTKAKACMLKLMHVSKRWYSLLSEVLYEMAIKEEVKLKRLALKRRNK